MARTLVPRFAPALDLATLHDSDLHKIVGDIKLAAPTSALVTSSPPMQTSVAALVAKSDNLAQANTAVADDRQKVRLDIAAEALRRSELHGELRTYAALTASLARSQADVHGAGLSSKAPRPPKNQPPTVPAVIENRPPKRGQGRTTVSVQETGPIRHQYAAEWSPDPVGPATWAQLGVGHGKTRIVTGASGTKVWVRFAMVRGQLQSEWSTPVLITIP